MYSAIAAARRRCQGTRKGGLAAEGSATVELLTPAVLATTELAVVLSLRVARSVLPIVLGAGTVLHLHGLRFLDYVSDDPFIPFLCAENSANGHGLVWNVADSR